MPELARFFGIIIRMYAEPGVPRHQPHFHAYYQNHVAATSIDTIDVIGGSFPKKQQRMVKAWVEIHKGESLENWERLQSGQPPLKIAPLR